MMIQLALCAFLFLLLFGGGFAVGYDVREKEEIRKNARRYERARNMAAMLAALDPASKSGRDTTA